MKRRNIMLGLAAALCLVVGPVAMANAAWIINKVGYQQVIITDPLTGVPTSGVAPLAVDSGPQNAAAITLTGNTSYSPTLRGIWVGTTGNIAVDMAGGTGTQVTFQSVPVGFFPGHFTKVYSTANGTTASNLVAVW